MTDRQKLTLSELKLTPEYQRLTQKQQLFVATYCESGLTTGQYDGVFATQTAYKCKSAEVARIMSYSLLGNIRILAALNRHFNATPTEELLVLLNKAINNKNLTMAQVTALKLKCDIMGIPHRLPPEKTSIGVVPADMLKESQKKPKKPSSVKAAPAAGFGILEI